MSPGQPASLQAERTVGTAWETCALLPTPVANCRHSLRLRIPGRGAGPPLPTLRDTFMQRLLPSSLCPPVCGGLGPTEALSPSRTPFSPEWLRGPLSVGAGGSVAGRGRPWVEERQSSPRLEGCGAVCLVTSEPQLPQREICGGRASAREVECPRRRTWAGSGLPLPRQRGESWWEGPLPGRSRLSESPSVSWQWGTVLPPRKMGRWELVRDHCLSNQG